MDRRSQMVYILARHWQAGEARCLVAYQDHHSLQLLALCYRERLEVYQVDREDILMAHRVLWAQQHQEWVQRKHLARQVQLQKVLVLD
jgi:hypothetical protein